MAKGISCVLSPLSWTHDQGNLYGSLKMKRGIITVVALHCVNGGEVVDPFILKHHERAPAPMISRARIAPKTGLTGSVEKG